MTYDSRCSLYFHRVVETDVKVLESEKADETRVVGECFHSCFAWFSQSFATFFITIQTQRTLSISDKSLKQFCYVSMELQISLIHLQRVYLFPFINDTTETENFNRAMIYGSDFYPMTVLVCFESSTRIWKHFVGAENGRASANSWLEKKKQRNRWDQNNVQLDQNFNLIYSAFFIDSGWQQCTQNKLVID